MSKLYPEVSENPVEKPPFLAQHASGSCFKLRVLTRENKDVHERLAVVETSGHDAVGPQPLGAQFVHFSAGGDGVAAGHHPVIGRRGDDDADPAHEARDEAHHLQACGYHGGSSDVPVARPTRTVPPALAWTRPALGFPSAALASRWLRDTRGGAGDAASAAVKTGAPGGDNSATGQRAPALSLNSVARASKRQSATAPGRADQSRAGRVWQGEGLGEGAAGRPAGMGDARSALESKLIPSRWGPAECKGRVALLLHFLSVVSS